MLKTKISFFIPSLIAISFLLHKYNLGKYQIKWQAKLSENIIPYNITNYINEQLPITATAARYFLSYNFSYFLNNYQSIRPNQKKIEYHRIFPFHSDGKSKKDINFREYFYQENVIIRHYSKYLDNGDKFEVDKSVSRILSINYNEDNELLEKLTPKKFTLIYLITLTLTSSFLIREIKAMSHPNIAFILFIDNKCNRTEIYNHFLNIDESLYRTFENVYFIDSPRFQVGWGRITQALSQAVLMFATLKYFTNSLYLSFHSESDYPIVPNEFILKYLNLNYPSNYMEIIPKTEQEYKNKRITSLFIFLNESEKLINSIKYLFPKRIIPPFSWSQGANWFTLTISDSRKIIDLMLNNFSIIEHLDYSFHADEILFQTLVTEAKIHTKKNYHRYIDWTQGGNNPRLLDEMQFDKIIEDPCNFWARKFNNNKSQKVLNMIDNYIIKIRNINGFRMC